MLEYDNIGNLLITGVTVVNGVMIARLREGVNINQRAIRDKSCVCECDTYIDLEIQVSHKRVLKTF